MNENMNKTVRLALIFGFAGAVGIPLAYELYGNLSRTIAVFLLLCGAVFAGIKFSQFKFKEAFIGLVFMFVLMTGFSIVAFMIIHPWMVDFLEDRSRYFYMSTVDSVKFFVKAAAVQLAAVGVCVLKGCWKYFIKKLKENSEATRAYIDNAFDD